MRITNEVVPVGSLLAGPVPEPSTWALAVLAGVTIVRRKRAWTVRE